VIRVVVADDHALVRRSVGEVLAAAEDLEVVASAGDGHQALAAVEATDPDVVVMDRAMPGLDGIEAARAIRDRHPSTAVVVLSDSPDTRGILEALGAGAAGYLLKGAGSAELLGAVRAAAAGDTPLYPRVAESLLELGPHRNGCDRLTPREREVLALLAQGLRNRDIACRLGIAEKTVRGHLTAIFDHLGVSGRIQAALWAQPRRAWLEASLSA
jgi:DNA-binding NarL/FixJ family response regulator